MFEVKTDNTTEEDWWNDINDDEFQTIFRMSKTTLIDLQAEIDYSENVFIDRVDKLLLVCLWILGNTKSFQEAEKLFNIEDVENNIQDYFNKILQLGSSYVVWPSPEELEEVQKGFAVNYKFPKLIGVIGSVHIEVEPKVDEKLEYYNHIMQKHTIVLQVVCDNNLLLRDVCIGCPGGKTISEILENSPLYTLLNDGNGSIIKNNYLLLGGTEHPRLNNLVTPLSTNNVNEHQFQFNELHYSVMAVMEQTLKCMETRFPRLTSVDKFSPEMASLLASCICVLHNFTRVRNDKCELYL